MRAITIPPGFSFTNLAKPKDVVLIEDFPTPVPTTEQCLIRVHATGISRYELNWEGTYTCQIPRIPCFDVAGTIISSPAHCNFQPGDKVFGLLSWFGQGGMAEFVVSEPEYLARIPDWVDPIMQSNPFEYAAVLPRAALTAWQALKVELGGVLRRGQNVLVTGAAGAVGRFGVQIARDVVGPKHIPRGAKVIAYGFKDDELATFADIHIQRNFEPGNSENWANEIDTEKHEIDVVFDTVGGAVLETSLKVVKAGGIVVTIGTPIPNLNELQELGFIKEGVKFHFFVVKESGDQLREIAEMVQEGKLKPEIGAIANEMTEESVRSSWKSYDDHSLNLKGGIVVKIYDPEN